MILERRCHLTKLKRSSNHRSFWVWGCFCGRNQEMSNTNFCSFWRIDICNTATNRRKMSIKFSARPISSWLPDQMLKKSRLFLLETLANKVTLEPPIFLKNSAYICKLCLVSNKNALIFCIIKLLFGSQNKPASWRSFFHFLRYRRTHWLTSLTKFLITSCSEIPHSIVH